MKAVVTGGNGFLGSHLVEALVRDGVEVHAVANRNHQRLDVLLPSPQVHVYEDPFAAAELVTRVQPEVIFHLAAVYAEPVEIECIRSMLNGNLALGAALLFGASRCERPAAFVNTGTYWQFSEEGEFAPNTFYAATKQAFQDLLFFYERKSFVSAVTLVLYDTFGPDDERAKLWTQLLKMKPGSSIELSGGEQVIEVVHLEDVIRGFLHAAKLLMDGERLEPVYALATGKDTTLREMLVALNRRADLRLDLQWGKRPYWDGQLMRPWRGATLPGWEPRIDVLDALVESASRCSVG